VVYLSPLRQLNLKEAWTKGKKNKLFRRNRREIKKNVQYEKEENKKMKLFSCLPYS
jgi:hypothetical protein